jgi:hypothetical protein
MIKRNTVLRYSDMLTFSLLLNSIRQMRFTGLVIVIALLQMLPIDANNPRTWTSSDCVEPSKPSGYNFDDSTFQLLPPDFTSQLQHACRATHNFWQGKIYVDPGSCVHWMSAAENQLVNLFWTSDVDLSKIYMQMFGCNQYTGVSLLSVIQGDNSALVATNQTIFGTKTDPGLLKDLFSLMDGVDHIKSLAEGQLRSIQTASASQVVAAQALQAQLVQVASSILENTLSVMQLLVGNRTQTQTQAFSMIAGQVSQATKDIESQSNSIQSYFATTFNQLNKRYNQWSAASEQGIADVTDRQRLLQSEVAQSDQIAQKITGDLTTLELANVATAVNAANNGFDSDLASAQASIAKDVEGVTTDLLNSVVSSRSQFGLQVDGLARNVNDRSNALRASLATAPAALATSAVDAQRRVDASVLKVRELLKTSIMPLVADVQTAMQNVVGLSAAIDSIRSQVNADLSTIKAASQQDILELAGTVSESFGAIQSDFTNKFQPISDTMEQGISKKVQTGRGQLASIMSGAQSSQSDAANQQAIQAQAAQDQAAASKTAAALVSAQQQTAADGTKAGLDTMIKVVGSAMADSQQTMKDVAQANIGNIASVNSQLSSNQEATMNAAYSQVRAGDQSSATRNADSQSDSFDAQQTGQDLEQSISQSGAQLDTTVAYQNRQAQSLLGQINDLVNYAKQSSGTLQDQMKTFEQQAPALYATLQQKIAAYKALLVSQGQQAQANAAGSAASESQNALASLASSLQQFTGSSQGVSPDLSADQNSVATDANSLVNDITALNDQLNKQSAAGGVLVNNTAQVAMTQSMESIKSVSKDSAAALAALVTYNKDLINLKRSDILSSGDAAMESATQASDYLTENARHFVKLSQQFITDANNLEGQASQNLTSMVNQINQTLSDLRTSSELYLSRLNDAASQISAWPNEILQKASTINAAVQAKAADVTSTIMTIAAASMNSTSGIQSSLNAMQTFVDQLSSIFDLQRTHFNDFARQFSNRRVELMAGLNQTISSQRGQFLSGLTSTDLAEARNAGRSTDSLQGLMTSLEKAKAQGSTNMNQVTALMGKIGDGVGGLTNSFASKMGVDLDALKQKAAKDAILTQQGIGSTVGTTGTSANMLAGNLANALDQISQSELAAQFASSGATKDVYAIAGLLKNAGQETQMKVSSLLKSLESGNMTFTEALGAANDMTKRDVSSVMDILNVFTQYLSNQIGQVYDFNASVLDSVNALNTTATKSIVQHVEINAQALGDMAVQQYKLGNMSNYVLSDPATGSKGILDTTEAQRNQSIVDMETFMNAMLHGTAESGSSGAFLQMRSRLASISRAIPRLNTSLPDAVNQANVNLATATTEVSTAKNLADNAITASIAQANAAISDILNITKTALSSR